MDDFITVYDLLESGYRGMGWALALGGLLLAVLGYLVWLKPDSRGERIYRRSLSLVWVLACSVTLGYHYRGYSTYFELVNALRDGNAQQTTGVITAVQAEGYFLYVDVEGQRFRCSRHQWPFYLGFWPGDFPLQPTFLVKVHTVDEIIVRLAIHRASLAE
jgi:hypothetical protein